MSDLFSIPAQNEPPASAEHKAFCISLLYKLREGAGQRLKEIIDEIYKATRLSVLDVVGIGATGLVFIARHDTLEIFRAVKVVHYGYERERTRQALISYLSKSLRTVARMHHPHVIRVHDFYIGADYSFFVMDLHNPGRTFRTYIASPVQPPTTEIFDRLEEILDALAYCHSFPADLKTKGARGVFVHGDLKPENILFDVYGRAVVTDWLIPNLRGDRFNLSEPYHGTNAYGTPRYMPREQEHGGIVTPASDVWAFGVLMFEVLTRKYPFEQRGSSYVHENPRPLAAFRQDAPAWTQAILDGCLTEANQRFTNGMALQEAWYRLSGRKRTGLKARSQVGATIRVFLSSTFQGLEDERKHVSSALDRMTGVKCIALERAGTSPISPRDHSMDHVSRSDLLVLIIADRYGTLDATTGLSITELEYERASREHIPILIYVRVRGTVTIHSFSGKYNLEARAEQFLTRISANLVYSTFESPSDLTLKVVCDLVDFLGS
jgi:serine/threonine protein kinase